MKEILKTCANQYCQEWNPQPLSSFQKRTYKSKKGKGIKDSFRNTCENCRKRYAKLYREKNLERYKERDFCYYKENSVEAKEKAKSRWSKLSDEQKKNRALKKYGITHSEYEAFVRTQNNLCAICKKPETVVRAGKVQNLSVDHDHKNGTVRGLLCNKCNQALGLIEESREIAIKMLHYIEKHIGESNGS